MNSWHQYPRRDYRHKRLKRSTSIRVLDLYPAETSSEPLRSHLQEVFLDRRPEYEAVSYAWGSGERTGWMEIDHGTYLITHNCDEVLRRLRHRTKTRKLWIDSVCIDQAFQLERNHQVGMMGEVYSKADRVIVWLGRATKDTNAAIKFLLDLAEETRPGWRRQVTFGELLYRKVLKIMDGNSLVCKQVTALFEREWFSRIWPIQEIALARDCRIICGSSSIPIELFMVCLKVLRNATFTLDSIHRVHLHREMWDQVQYYREHGKTKRVTTCSRLLLSARYQNASEPRDKIFAFHGLFDLLGVQFPAPDYTKSIPRIYLEAAAITMMNDNCLEILSSLTGVNTIEGCPSWVPDWSDSRPISEISIWEENNAARSSFPQYQFWNQGLLMLAGRVIDVVQENSIAFPSSHYCPELRPTESAILKQWLSQFEDAARGFKLADFFADLCEPSWWHTYHYKAFPTEAPFQWVEAVRNLREDSTSALDKVLHDWEVLLFAEKNKARTFKGSPPTTSSLVRLHLLLRKLLDRKVMFKTAQCRLGIGSMMLQPGDQVALYSGCNLPMIIRPGQKYWQFVAPAYVYGIMEGSAWSDRKSLQNFVFS